MKSGCFLGWEITTTQVRDKFRQVYLKKKKKKRILRLECNVNKAVFPLHCIKRE